MAKQTRRPEEAGKAAENVATSSLGVSSPAGIRGGETMIAHGVVKTSDGWVAFTASNASGVTLLTPERAGKVGESQTSAIARMTKAQQQHLHALVSGRG